MKLTYFQIESHLLKTLAPLYVIGGEDIFLKNDTLRLIRKAARQANYTERVRFSKETDNWDVLYSTLYAPSLFNENKLIEIQLDDSLPPKPLANLLESYAKNPIATICLVLITGKIDAKMTATRWYKALDKIGIMVAIWPLNPEQFPTWLMARAKKYNLTFETPALSLLTEYVAGNLIAANEALEKIYLLKPVTAITVAMIQSLFADESHYSIFDFVDSLVSGDRKQTLHRLQQLQAEGVEPILVLWALVREIRLLAMLAQAVKNGTSLEQAFKAQRVFPRKQAAMRAFLTRHSLEACFAVLGQLITVDRLIKGVTTGDPWISLQSFSLKLV